MNELGGGAFQLLAITKTNIIEVHESDEVLMWFKVKLSMVAFDDESGKEKQSAVHSLSAHMNTDNVSNLANDMRK